MRTSGASVSDVAFMAFTIRALDARGFTGGVPFMPIRAFITITPTVNMTKPAKARKIVCFIHIKHVAMLRCSHQAPRCSKEPQNYSTCMLWKRKKPKTFPRVFIHPSVFIQEWLSRATLG
jgi:hypothetical protein